MQNRTDRVMLLELFGCSRPDGAKRQSHELAMLSHMSQKWMAEPFVDIRSSPESLREHFLESSVFNGLDFGRGLVIVGGIMASWSFWLSQEGKEMGSDVSSR